MGHTLHSHFRVQITSSSTLFWTYAGRTLNICCLPFNFPSFIVAVCTFYLTHRYRTFLRAYLVQTCCFLHMRVRRHPMTKADLISGLIGYVPVITSTLSFAILSCIFSLWEIFSRGSIFRGIFLKLEFEAALTVSTTNALYIAWHKALRRPFSTLKLRY